MLPKIDLREYLAFLWENVAGNPCGKILREIFAGKSCGKFLRENLAGNPCGKILGNSCRKFLREISFKNAFFVGKCCGKILQENRSRVSLFLRENLVGKILGKGWCGTFLDL